MSKRSELTDCRNHTFHHGGQSESLVPPYSGSVFLSLLTLHPTHRRRFWRHLRCSHDGLVNGAHTQSGEVALVSNTPWKMSSGNTHILAATIRHKQRVFLSMCDSAAGPFLSISATATVIAESPLPARAAEAIASASPHTAASSLPEVHDRDWLHSSPNNHDGL